MGGSNSQTSVDAARRAYAERLRSKNDIREARVVEAFATVPRERFLGPGPWDILIPGELSTYRATEDADPRHVYQDVLIALDAKRGINNGQPTLWATLFDRLALPPGARVVHIGAGTGYYSAILAEIVGRSGEVTAVEIDHEFACRAREALALWNHVQVVEADGVTYRADPPVDAVIVNAGATQIADAWLGSLARSGGRLLVPFTRANRWGQFLLIGTTADPAWLSAQAVCPTGIIECVGGRSPEMERRLDAALTRSDWGSIRSLCRTPEPPDPTCWMAGAGWWLSTATPP